MHRSTENCQNCGRFPPLDSGFRFTQSSLSPAGLLVSDILAFQLLIPGMSQVLIVSEEETLVLALPRTYRDQDMAAVVVLNPDVSFPSG